MTTAELATEREAKERAQKKDAFSRFMDQPATRMMLSMIPPGENKEVLTTLLQETFNAGWGGGSGQTAGSFLEVILKGMEKKSQRDVP